MGRLIRQLSTFKSYLPLDNIPNPKNPYLMKLIFTLWIVILTCSVADAQVFVDQSATGNNDGTSWTDAYLNLQDAIDASNPGEQIWIAAGIYKPAGPAPESSHFYLTEPVALYGGFTGIETDLTQRNWQTNVTIMSGDINGDDIEADFLGFREDNAHHIFILDAGNEEIILDGMVFKGGTTLLDVYAPETAPSRTITDMRDPEYLREIQINYQVRLLLKILHFN
jgi:hypothetical protein